LYQLRNPSDVNKIVRPNDFVILLYDQFTKSDRLNNVRDRLTSLLPVPRERLVRYSRPHLSAPAEFRNYASINEECLQDGLENWWRRVLNHNWKADKQQGTGEAGLYWFLCADTLELTRTFRKLQHLWSPEKHRVILMSLNKKHDEDRLEAHVRFWTDTLYHLQGRTPPLRIPLKQQGGGVCSFQDYFELSMYLGRPEIITNKLAHELLREPEDIQLYI